MSKRKLKVDEDGLTVRDEGGDIVAEFLNKADAIAFAHSSELIDAARKAYGVMIMPMQNARTRHYISNDLNIALARVEGKMP
jgi:hypothetical protein